jgi:hypothetical protein
MVSALELREGLRMVRRARAVRRGGFRKYEGTPVQICEQIVKDAYDPERRYFRVSSGHFCEFYMRDFAFCCEALVSLGYAKEVELTLRYALEHFRIHGRVEGSISPDGKPFTFPRYGPDSLALLLYALRRTGNEQLAVEYHKFLRSQVDEFLKRVVDPATLLPYKEKRFSCIRDHARRKAACYDAVMIAVVARESAALGLEFPLTEKEITDAIIANYWSGIYFFEDLTKQSVVAGDANVFPFWTGIITGHEMRDNALAAMQAAYLDEILPLRYVGKLHKDREKVGLHIANLFAKDYETDSIWAHLGLAYLRVLADHNPELCRKHLAQYTKRIEKYKTFLEVYDSNGEPFRTAFYVTDEAMLWAANYLALKRQLSPKSEEKA